MCKVFENVKVLCHQHHVNDLARLKPARLLHRLDTSCETACDSSPHFGRAHAGKMLGLRLRLCGTHGENLCSLGLLHCGFTFASRRVDLVHGCHHCRVWLHVCHQGLDNNESKLLQVGRQHLFHVTSNLFS